MKKNSKYIIRRTHRILGVLIGIQFLFWTLSGLYFSWTDIDEIHGDHFLKDEKPVKSKDLIGISEITKDLAISDLEIRHIGREPYYWVNNQNLYNARTGKKKEGVTQEEAIGIVRGRVCKCKGWQFSKS